MEICQIKEEFINRLFISVLDMLVKEAVDLDVTHDDQEIDESFLQFRDQVCQYFEAENLANYYVNYDKYYKDINSNQLLDFNDHIDQVVIMTRVYFQELFQKVVKASAEEIRNLQEEMEILRSVNSELKEQSETLIHEKNMFKEDLFKLQERYETLEKEDQDKREEFNVLKKKVEGLINEKNNLEILLNRQDTSRQVESIDISDLENRHKEEMKVLREKMEQDLIKHKSELEQKYNNEIENREIEIKSLNTKINELRKTENVLNETLQRENETKLIENLFHEIRKTTGDVENILEKYNEKIKTIDKYLNGKVENIINNLKDMSNQDYYQDQDFNDKIISIYQKLKKLLAKVIAYHQNKNEEIFQEIRMMIEKNLFQQFKVKLDTTKAYENKLQGPPQAKINKIEELIIIDIHKGSLL